MVVLRVEQAQGSHRRKQMAEGRDFATKRPPKELTLQPNGPLKEKQGKNTAATKRPPKEKQETNEKQSQTIPAKAREKRKEAPAQVSGAPTVKPEPKRRGFEKNISPEPWVQRPGTPKLSAEQNGCFLWAPEVWLKLRGCLLWAG